MENSTQELSSRVRDVVLRIETKKRIEAFGRKMKGIF